MSSLRSSITLFGWLVAILGTVVYMITLQPSVSFWDCGEFIATSYLLQVGHPPGAPLYTLLAHCFTLLAGGDVAAVAWWSNLLSAVAGGLTAMFLFWTIVRLTIQASGLSDFRDVGFQDYRIVTSLVGTGCYLFCDTAWFSAVESEVYSLAMLFASAIVWATVRWWQSADDAYSPRWLLLVAFLLGLSVGVHQLCLLTVPAVLLVVVIRRRSQSRGGTSEFRQRGVTAVKRFRKTITVLPLIVFFFAIGLTPYLIIPIRAAADPPINMGAPSTFSTFKSYVTREQYEKAPLIYGRCFNSPVIAYQDGKPVYAPEMDMFFPRMWKSHEHAEQYYTDWGGRRGEMVRVGSREYYKPSFVDNLVFLANYQLGYMYLRYFMWNFAGRSLRDGSHNCYLFLPLLIGLVGAFSQFRRDRGGWWVVMVLFLMSSVVLSVYLNHPVYEPRERDYAYILSFYAFSIWIGMGANAVLGLKLKLKRKRKLRRKRDSKFKIPVSQIGAYALLAVPLLVAIENWDDHDRSGRYVARDSAINLLASCTEGGVLFTAGDNDTFPLWYVQQVEGIRRDVTVVNLSLLGSDSYTRGVAHRLRIPETHLEGKGPMGRMYAIIKYEIETRDGGSEKGGMQPSAESPGYSGSGVSEGRPLFFSQYAYDAVNDLFDGNLFPSGIAYRFVTDSSMMQWVIANHYSLLSDSIKWSPIKGRYIDETSYGFLRQYWRIVKQSVKQRAGGSLR